jgi:hypothetical protein
MGLPDEASPADRRQYLRIVPRRKLACDADGPGGPTVHGEVQDFSAGGLAFLCPRGWKAGEVLKVRMLAPAGAYLLEAELRVVRSARLRSGDWLVAGAFLVTLSPVELGPFLSE